MRALLTVALLGLAVAAGAAPEAPLTSRDAGLYVGVAGDYMYGPVPFAFSLDQVSRGTDPVRLRQIIERLHANGKRSLLDIFLYEKPDETAKPAAEYMAWLDPLLAQLPLEKVYAITLSEENIYWNGHAEMLAELYRLVKAKYPTLAVYQWYSPGAGAPGFGPWPLLPADGWVIDEYCAPRDRFENLVRKYTLLDKPLIHLTWAAPGWKEFATWDQVWDDQLAVCRRYNVPLGFFCWWPPDSTPPPPGNQSMWSWSAPPGTEHHRVWNQMVLPYVQRLRQGLRDPEDGNTSRGQEIPVAGDEQGQFAYHEDFRANPRFVDEADLDGFLGLRWTGQRLEAKPGRKATLTYRFVSPFALHDVQAAIAGTGGLKLALSTDGKQWVPGKGLTAALREGPDRRRFLVRITLASRQAPLAALEDLRVTARVDPPAVPQVTLTPAADGRVTFTDDLRSQLYLHVGRVTNPGELKWVPGRLGVHGKQGQVNEGTVDYHFVCARPLQDLRVTVNCAADKANYGAAVTLALSADGQTFSEAAATDVGGKPVFRGDLTAGPLGEARDFWVRVTLRNSCGVTIAVPAPCIYGLTVTGRVAGR